MASRYNYNVDVRLFAKEKLRSFRWLAWIIGGLVACLLPALLASNIPLAVGLSLSWLCILFAVAGVIWSDANQKELNEFAIRHKLVYNPRLSSLQPDGRPIQDTAIGAQLADLLDFSQVKNIALNDVLTSKSDEGLQITMCKVSFEYNEQTQHRVYQYSLVLCTNIAKDFPAFAVDAKKVYDFTRFVKLPQKQKLQLEGSFGEQFSVYSSPDTRINMLSFFTPDVMEIYQSYFERSSFVSKNGQIALLSRNNIYEDDAYTHIYEGIELLRKKLERYDNLHLSI